MTITARSSFRRSRLWKRAEAIYRHSRTTPGSGSQSRTYALGKEIATKPVGNLVGIGLVVPIIHSANEDLCMVPSEQIQSFEQALIRLLCADEGRAAGFGHSKVALWAPASLRRGIPQP